MLTFDVLRSVVFFYIKTPLRVKEAGLEELIPTTWWPTRFDKEVRPFEVYSHTATWESQSHGSQIEIPSCLPNFLDF